jgi:hypothetical protein
MHRQVRSSQCTQQRACLGERCCLSRLSALIPIATGRVSVRVRDRVQEVCYQTTIGKLLEGVIFKGTRAPSMVAGTFFCAWVYCATRRQIMLPYSRTQRRDASPLGTPMCPSACFVWGHKFLTQTTNKRGGAQRSWLVALQRAFLIPFLFLPLRNQSEFEFLCRCCGNILSARVGGVKMRTKTRTRTSIPPKQIKTERQRAEARCCVREATEEKNMQGPDFRAYLTPRPN